MLALDGKQLRIKRGRWTLASLSGCASRYQQQDQSFDRQPDRNEYVGDVPLSSLQRSGQYAVTLSMPSEPFAIPEKMECPICEVMVRLSSTDREAPLRFL